MKLKNLKEKYKENIKKELLRYAQAIDENNILKTQAFDCKEELLDIILKDKINIKLDIEVYKICKLTLSELLLDRLIMLMDIDQF